MTPRPSPPLLGLNLPPPLARPRPLQAKASKTKLKSKVCIVNATIPAADGVLDPSDMIAYLAKRIKVAGRAGNLGTSVTVEQDKKTPSHVVVKSIEPVELSKRYIKCAWAPGRPAAAPPPLPPRLRLLWRAAYLPPLPPAPPRASRPHPPP